MDLRKLKKLIDLVQESGIGELEITEGEEKVRISRAGTAAPMVMATQPMQMLPAGIATGPAAGTAPAEAAPAAAEPAGHTLKSPMVGTFYRSPSPGAPSFVAARPSRLPRRQPPRGAARCAGACAAVGHAEHERLGRPEGGGGRARGAGRRASGVPSLRVG